jgi:hypothetical protein
MKNKFIIIFLMTTFLTISCTSTTIDTQSYWDNCTFLRATTRSQEFVDAINEQNPTTIYNMLSEEYKAKIDKEEFVERYIDDLSYPYISPLYCYLQKIDLHYDVNGIVSCKVASRLIGEKFTFTIIYENSDYFFEAFDDIIDNSYRNKFDNKVVKWI